MMRILWAKPMVINFENQPILGLMILTRPKISLRKTDPVQIHGFPCGFAYSQILRVQVGAAVLNDLTHLIANVVGDADMACLAKRQDLNDISNNEAGHSEASPQR
jgi:hypothetical protein